VEDKVAPVLQETVREEIVREDAKIEVPQENKIDEVTAEAKAEEPQDPPITMAAATAEAVANISEGASRWAAVPVDLGGEEATASLEQEMQKAYAAFVPAAAESAVLATAQEVAALRAEDSSSPEVAPVEANAGIAPPAEFAEANAAPAPVAESVSSVAEAIVPDPAGPVVRDAVTPESVAPEVPELQPAPEAEPAIAEPVSASSSDAASIAGGEDHASEHKPDFETVKSTAAAWASWRQMRDTRKDGEAAQAQSPSTEFEVSEPAPAEAAMAVAAGAEQILQEVTAAPKGDRADVASIVDSVLADLRPKLMEEISRKMAEKK
jgi:hypothetical protein